VKSEVSILRCVAFVSVSVVSLIVAYKLGKDQRRTNTWYKSPPPNKVIALEEGQTILAVVDEPKSMQFYIGNNVMDNGD
jgi:hypothetical protein